MTTGAIIKKNFCLRMTVLPTNVRSLMAVLCVLIILPVINSCAVNPATGSANLVLMSENKEK